VRIKEQGNTFLIFFALLVATLAQNILRRVGGGGINFDCVGEGGIKIEDNVCSWLQLLDKQTNWHFHFYSEEVC
jgi:hypothetical protein